MRHAIGILDDQALQFREVEIGAVTVQISDLCFRDAALSADGRANVNSKRASNKRRNAEFSEAFEFRIDQLAEQLGLFHLTITPEEFGMMGGYLDGHNHVPELALCQGIDRAH